MWSSVTHLLARVKDEQFRTRRLPIADTWTTQVDQVIALKALSVMKPEGQAVLILGGKKGKEEYIRSERYNIPRESSVLLPPLPALSGHPTLLHLGRSLSQAGSRFPD